MNETTPFHRPRRRSVVPVTLVGLMVGALLVGCTATATTTTPDAATTSTTVAASTEQLTAAQVLAENEGGAVDESLVEWDAASAVEVDLDEPASADGATVEGSTVTITAAGTYVLTGSLDGQVVVDSIDDGTVQLVLDGASIANDAGPALLVAEASEAAVVLVGDNTLSDADTYADGVDANAALFSEVDLTIGGDGALTVTGNGNDGITSENDLVIVGGTIDVTAADDGLRGKDALVVTGGDITVEAGGDALKADNEDEATRGWVSISGGTVTADAAGDGIAAVTDVVLTGGSLDLTSGGGAGAALAEDASAKGVKAGVWVVLEGASVEVDAADDAVHSDTAVHLADGTLTAASADDGVHAEGTLYVSGGDTVVSESYEGAESGSIDISGGSLTVTASDDGVNASAGTLAVSGGTVVVDAEGDGIDVNGTATMSDGTVTVNGPEGNGNGALDVDGAFTVSGGTLLAAGSSGMVVAPSTDSPQASVAATVSLGAGDEFSLVDADGSVVASFTASKQAQSVVFSSEAIVVGETYEVQVNGATESTVVGGDTPVGGGMPGGGAPEGGMPAGGGQRPSDGGPGVPRG